MVVSAEYPPITPITQTEKTKEAGAAGQEQEFAERTDFRTKEAELEAGTLWVC